MSAARRPTVSGRVYASPRKRGFIDWRPQTRTRVLLGQIEAVLEEYAAFLPLAARQIFYRLVGQYYYPKEENAYERLTNVLVNARRAQMIPFEAIRDDGGAESLPTGFGGTPDYWDAVQNAAESYRRERSAVQLVRLEVWCEAAGMVPQLARVAHRYGIPVYSSGGFESVTEKYQAARRVAEDSRPTAILHVGDFDPSGLSILDAAADDVWAFAARLGAPCPARFERVAVTPEQIARFQLPTAPPKATDRRGGEWHGGTVQAEALAPSDVAAALTAAIEAEIDTEAHESVLEIEAQERAELIAEIGVLRGIEE